MRRFLATFYVGALVIALLATMALHQNAGAAVPEGGAVGHSICSEALPGGPATCAQAAPQVGEPGGMILAACQWQKPQNGCKRNPCDNNRMYCCKNYNCTPM